MHTLPAVKSKLTMQAPLRAQSRFGFMRICRILKDWERSTMQQAIRRWEFCSILSPTPFDDISTMISHVSAKESTTTLKAETFPDPNCVDVKKDDIICSSNRFINLGEVLSDINLQH